MRPEYARRNLNKPVLINSPRFDRGTVMRFNAVILRQDANGRDLYTAEVQDMRTDRTVYIVALDSVEEIEYEQCTFDRAAHFRP
jgi:hypothetical protein